MKDLDFKNYLKNSASSIDQSIQSYFDLWINENAHITSRLDPLIAVLRDGTKGGKRIRGALVSLGYSLAHGIELSSKEEKAITGIAVAYEIFQTAILAHDDIIDKSEQRRGAPTLYHQLGGSHYGISQTISMGDLGFFIAYKIIAESQFPNDSKTKSTTFFSDSMTKTVLGQMLDVEFAHKKFEITEQLLDEVLTIYKLKTAYYTFVAPLSLGAILGGADEKVLQQIQSFGESIGILFQINDDITDIFGKQKDSNKDRGADIKEGKITLLYAKAMQKADAEQCRVLSTYYGKALIDDETIKEVQTVFIETEALSYVQSLADQFEQKARASIPTLSSDMNIQKLFEEMVDYVSGKEKNK